MANELNSIGGAIVFTSDTTDKGKVLIELPYPRVEKGESPTETTEQSN